MISLVLETIYIYNGTLKSSYFGHDWGNGAVIPNSYGDYVTAVLHFLLKPPKTCFLDIWVTADDCAKMMIEDDVWPAKCVNSGSAAGFLYVTDGEYYRGYVMFEEITGRAAFTYHWAYDSKDYSPIPSTNFYSPVYVSLSPYQATVICEPGYSADSLTKQCVSKCGDGLKVSSEKCDDGNNSDGDGCKGDCSAIEPNWVCSGGSMGSKDVCVKCTGGFYQNDVFNPSSCISKCGDGLRIGFEKCDDGNTIDGDGCKGDCSLIETDYVCTGGNSTTKDSCKKCEYGVNQTVNPPVCSSNKIMEANVK